MYVKAYLQSAITILKTYDGKVPFAAWIKDYFKEHRKFGSRDRKWILRMCYAYFRLGNALPANNFEERIITGLFLTAGDDVAPVFSQLKPQWLTALSLPLHDKLAIAGIPSGSGIFPFAAQLSPQIEREKFDTSFLIQPDVYLRVRPGKANTVTSKLQEASMPFTHVSEDCLALPNSTSIDKVIQIDEEAVIQDVNSQRAMKPILSVLPAAKGARVWDCCAASGGKSILLHDHLPGMLLTVSDVRETILHNLRSRFKRAGVTSYRSIEADLSKPFPIRDQFDLIVCDAPCSGSGTWSRTPEQLLYFDIGKLPHYTGLQRQIASNASKRLKAGGYLLYITCSVLKEENEEAVTYLQQNTALHLVSSNYYIGYDRKADTLFSALFTLKNK